MTQESRPGFIGFSAQGLRRLQLSCWLGCILIWKIAQGKICFQAHSSVGKIYLFVSVWEQPSPFASCQLDATPQDLEVTHSSLPCRLLNMVTDCIKPARRNSSSSLLRWRLNNMIKGMTSLMFAILCWLEANHRSHLHSGKANIQIREYQASGDHGSHLNLCPPHLKSIL